MAKHIFSISSRILNPLTKLLVLPGLAPGDLAVGDDVEFSVQKDAVTKKVAAVRCAQRYLAARMRPRAPLDCLLLCRLCTQFVF